MNIFRTTAASYFLFDDTASGTGTPAPAGGAGTPPASSSPEPSSGTPAPSAQPPASTDGSAAPGNDPFSGLDGSYDEFNDDEVVLTGGDAGTEPATPSPAAAPAAAPAPAAQPPAASPSEPQPAPAPAAPAPTSQASQGDVLNETVDGLKANSAEMATWASQNLFKLSDADAQALATNAEEVIPRLMGQVYSQALLAAGNLMRNLIPQTIDSRFAQVTERRAKATEATDAFYKAHSDLNKETHGEVVAQWAKAFRAANPQATRQQAFDYVSRAVRIQFGLPMPGATPAPQPQQMRHQPFAPARPGGRMPAPPVEKDPYAGMGMDFDEVS